MPVSVHVAPKRGNAIEVAPTRDVDEVISLCPLNHQRIPFGHLSERVPDKLFVAGGEVGHARGVRSIRIGGSFHVKQSRRASIAVIAWSRSSRECVAMSEIRI